MAPIVQDGDMFHDSKSSRQNDGNADQVYHFVPTRKNGEFLLQMTSTGCVVHWVAVVHCIPTEEVNKSLFLTCWHYSRGCKKYENYNIYWLPRNAVRVTLQKFKAHSFGWWLGSWLKTSIKDIKYRNILWSELQIYKLNSRTKASFYCSFEWMSNRWFVSENDSQIKEYWHK